MQLHSNDCWRSSTGGSEQHKKEQIPEKGSSMWRKENEYMSHPGMQSGEGKKKKKIQIQGCVSGCAPTPDLTTKTDYNSEAWLQTVNSWWDGIYTPFTIRQHAGCTAMWMAGKKEKRQTAHILHSCRNAHVRSDLLFCLLYVAVSLSRTQSKNLWKFLQSRNQYWDVWFSSQ